MQAEKRYYPRPLFFWNAKPTKEGIREIMEGCSKKDGYAGFGILPYDACKLEYLGKEYLELYGFVLEEAKRLGLKICLYDEWWFPSGWAGGRLKNKYPEACAKRLDMEEFVTVGTKFSVALPQDGKTMAIVAMKEDKRIDVSDFVIDGYLEWEAPDDDWKILCFTLRASDWDHVDFLSKEAVLRFIECTHEVYYKNFSEYFGDVIDSAFYDEPQFYGVDGRMWTESFNDRFAEKYGESPAIYYPALFYDIGEDTAYARNALLSLRADLYAEAFPGTIQRWCTEHGISLTGHVDQEEVENPCGMTGDLMKSFLYQDIPGVDEIAFEGRASCAYKIVSSSAVNWGKRLVMCEVLGAFNQLTEDVMYRELYDLFTKGVNLIVPHAVWYDPKKENVIFQPELSYRNEYYGKILPSFNEYCATVASLLQNGWQVNSVAMLYPIESLQYRYTMNWGGDPYLGGPTTENNNYMRLGQYLSRELSVDFTFLHPDVLRDRSTVIDGSLSLQGVDHFQDYKVIFLPVMEAISLQTLTALKNFVEAGGILISVGELPRRAVEKGKSDEVSVLCEYLFGVGQVGDELTVKAHVNGGKCYTLPYSQRQEIKQILLNTEIDTQICSCASGLQYIHKRNTSDCYDVWYFANVGKVLESRIVLQGRWELIGIDPKTKEKQQIKAEYAENTTKFMLSLDEGQSILLVGKEI